MKLFIFSLVTIFSISSFANQNTDTKTREALAISLINATVSCEQTLAQKSGFSFEAVSNIPSIISYIRSNTFTLDYNQEISLISFHLISGSDKHSIHFHTNSSFNKVLSYTAKSSKVLSKVSFNGTYADPEFLNEEILEDYEIIECSVENKNPTDLE